jgi:hypothetical protein
MKHHPDRGGDDATNEKQLTMNTMNFCEILKMQHNNAADEYHQTTETAEEFRESITALLNIGDIVVELCGSWLWISGNTKEHKDELKALSCRWSDNKKMWYWRHPEDGRAYRKSKTSMSDIRTKYGSQVFTAAGETTGYKTIGATA